METLQKEGTNFSGNTYTNFSAQQADKFREFYRTNPQMTRPRTPLEMVRAFYKYVEPGPIPDGTLEVLDGYEAPPASDKAAQELAEKYGLDLRRIAGTGPSGHVYEADVKRHLASIMADMAPTPKAGTKGAAKTVFDAEKVE